MAINHFIPTVWSESLHQSLDARYVGVANCNREYEGEIKNMGSVVKICGVGSVNVGNYTKNTDMNSPQALSDTVCELTIDQAKYFNFQIDDIDRAQCTPKLMDAAMKVAASGLAATADRYVYSLYKDHANKIDALDIYADPNTGIFQYFVKAREMLYSNNVFDDSEIVLEVSPKIASYIFQNKLDLSTSNGELLETGCIGSILGCKVFVTNGIVQENLSEDQTLHHCFMRTKRAIAFAEQLSEIEAYRPEQRFADAVKGLHLYGAKIVYPEELVVINLGIYNN